MKYHCVLCGPVEGTCDGMDGSMMQNCPAEPDEDDAYETIRQIEIDKEHENASTKEKESNKENSKQEAER